jgi:hypothetical protein
MLVSDEDRIQTGESLEAVRKNPGVEQDSGAVQLGQKAGMLEVGESHTASMRTAGRPRKRGGKLRGRRSPAVPTAPQRDSTGANSTARK